MKTWYVTGDFHGHWENFAIRLTKCEGENPALIVLGDAGFNFYLNKTDKKLKQKVCASGIEVYCVRGNHEQRPELVEGMILAFDPEVDNTVYYEPEYPNIKYFRDGATYKLNDRRTLVIGGAYSVDKWYRLQRGWTWFENEQLTPEEMGNIQGENYGECFDFVLSHTCPVSWEPTDLFLSGLDQSTVDASMEVWLEEFKDQINWGIWLFGHFHANRMVRPNVEMYYHEVDSLENIIARWDRYDDEEDYSAEHLDKDPKFYWGS